MFDASLRPLIDPPLGRLAARLARFGLTANQMTLGGFALGVVAMAAVAMGMPLLGLACFLSSRIADGLDGALARHRGITDLGGYLDIVLDFIVYAGMAFAFAVDDPARNAPAAAFLLFSFMGTGSSFLAFAIMAAKRGIETSARGSKSLYYLGGLTEGTETIAVLALACLRPDWFVVLAYVYGGLCWLTTASRIATAWQVLR